MSVATLEVQNTINTFGSIVPAEQVKAGNHIVFRTLEGRKSGLVIETNTGYGYVHIEFIGKGGTDRVVLRPGQVIGVMN